MKDALKAYRDRAGLSQLDVACALGIQQSTVSMWENGNSKPKTDMLPAIAKLYGCSIDDLYRKEEEA